MPVDLDLRLVRYFVVVADHRHFGRAATALRVAQPSLSRQIRRLEQQLGTQLLDRTPQGTRLTEAGEVFLPAAKALLRSAARAAAQTRAAAQPSRITIGYTTGLIVTPAARELRRQHPDADVHPRALKGEPFTYWDYRAGMFHKGEGMRIDLVLLSGALATAVQDAYIDRDARKGKKPSDHAPVVVDLNVPVGSAKSG